jgi:hypothetical protein
LEYTLSSSSPAFDSDILSAGLDLKLVELCEFSLDDKWKLLYRASEDGFSGEIFHTQCDNHPRTLTVIETTNGFIFGGYTEQCWNHSDTYKTDKNAFIFSLLNNENKPIKIKVEDAEKAIYCSPSYGPTFGDDINICNIWNQQNYSNLGFAYNHPMYEFESEEARKFLANSCGFQISDIEVYKRPTHLE